MGIQIVKPSQTYYEITNLGANDMLICQQGDVVQKVKISTLDRRYSTITVRVIDNLTSTDATTALSANMGRVLNEKLLNLNSNSVLTQSFSCSGNASITGDLTANDATLRDIDADSVSLTNNATVGGTLSVTGESNLGTINENGTPLTNKYAPLDQFMTIKNSFRNIYVSTSQPDNTIGVDGDIWIVYEA